MDGGKNPRRVVPLHSLFAQTLRIYLLRDPQTFPPEKFHLFREKILQATRACFAAIDHQHEVLALVAAVIEEAIDFDRVLQTKMHLAVKNLRDECGLTSNGLCQATSQSSCIAVRR